MKEKLALHNITSSHQHLNGAPSSSTSRQPTLYESTTDVRDSRVHWADEEQGRPEEA